ncbi:uncharacterized protein METZ01_LOCUS112270, partial [marine metagenome]
RQQLMWIGYAPRDFPESSEVSKMLKHNKLEKNIYHWPPRMFSLRLCLSQFGITGEVDSFCNIHSNCGFNFGCNQIL